MGPLIAAISVRPADRTDIPAIAAVERSAGQLFAGTHMDWAVGDTTDPGELASAVKRGDLWVADDGGTIAGFLLAGTLAGAFYLHEIAVAAAFQRRGVGRMLIEVALGEAKRRGHPAATLTTDRELRWNAPYYERLGFRTLTVDETPPRLAARLASQPSPERRCAMIREL